MQETRVQSLGWEDALEEEVVTQSSILGFPGDSDDKASACNKGDLSSSPGLERSPGEGNGNPLQCSCLENSMDGWACWATVHAVAKSRKRLSDFTLIYSVVLASGIQQSDPIMSMCIHIYILSYIHMDSFPLWFITRCWIWLHVLYGRTLFIYLFIYFIYSLATCLSILYIQ